MRETGRRGKIYERDTSININRERKRESERSRLR